MSGKYRDRILACLLSRASHAVSAGFLDVVRRRGYTVRQWHVLANLWDEDSMTLGELSEVVPCEQSTTTRLVDRLHALGLLGKRIDEGDRRRVHVFLTERGRERIRDLVALSDAAERETAGRLGAARTEALKRELRDLIGRLPERAPGDGIGAGRGVAVSSASGPSRRRGGRRGGRRRA